MKKILLVLVLALFQVGCASMKYNYQPKVSNLDFPPLNQETTVYLGEAMLVQGQQMDLEVLKVKELAKSLCFDVQPGLYEKKGFDAEKDYFSHIGDSATVIVGALCDPVQGMYVDKKSKDLCIITISGQTVCMSANYEIGEVQLTGENSFQRNLIFSGFDGKKVNFMYVERQGFQTGLSHNISYDISKNKIIGYRGAKIKVISYTNESITYVVLQNFSDR